MNNSGSMVRIERANDPPRMVGKFCTTNRIQRLTAPARELIQSTNTLKRLLDFVSRGKQPRGLEKARSLNPRFLEYWQTACELIKEEILARCRLLVQIGFQRLRLVKKENPVKPRVRRPLKPQYGNDPPKGFVPLPDAEIGGCARNDSLITPLVN